MKTNSMISALCFTAVMAVQAVAQGPEGRSLDDATIELNARLEERVQALAAFREQVAAERGPLNTELRELQAQLSELRREHTDKMRLVDVRNLDLSKLTSKNQSLDADAKYVSTLLSDYVRNFDSRLHVVERQRYREVLGQAKLAAENTALAESEVFATQTALVDASIDRFDDALGGVLFDGHAVDPNGQVKEGTFVLIGPAAIFEANDGTGTGSVEQRVDSSEPAAMRFSVPEDEKAASMLIRTGGAGSFPLDPTLGNAVKLEATQDTFIEHVQKGGAVMIPIFVLAGTALLIALIKWFSLMMVRKPSKRRVKALLEAVSRRDEQAAKEKAEALLGPTGRMLCSGVEHLREPRELIEEVMYESVLRTKHSLNSFLPFIAICAASAPLLGLLGTVTGIINTFNLISVYGTGNAGSLSAGISEALITTKFGLIVAIPSLLLHAYLSRKAKRHHWTRWRLPQ